MKRKVKLSDRIFLREKRGGGMYTYGNRGSWNEGNAHGRLAPGGGRYSETSGHVVWGCAWRTRCKAMRCW